MNNTQEQAKLLQEFPVNSYEDWLKEAEATLKGKPIEKLNKKTYEGIEIKPIYTKDSIRNLKLTDNEFPGFLPFIRGTSLVGFKQNAWQIEQDINEVFPDEFNSALTNDLSRGQTAINLKVNPLSFGNSKVCCCGDKSLLLLNLSEVSKAFNGIEIDKYPIRISSGKYQFISAAMLIANAKRNSVDLSKVKFNLGLDPIFSLAVLGELHCELSEIYDEMAAVIKYFKGNSDNVKVINIKGLAYGNAGASAVQELAFSFSTAVEFIRQLISRGLEINEICKNITFTFSLGSNFFVEIAKIRAARLIWSQIVKEFGGNEDSAKMVIFTRTTNLNKSKLDQYVNMLRVTTEALSAIVAGVDSINIGSFDEQFGISKEFARRVARNTQFVLQDECNLLDVIDPAGGSWFIESLTSELANEIWKLFQSVEGKEGIVSALTDGNIQKDINDLLQQRIKNLSTRKDVILGVNKYPNKNEKDVNIKNVTSEQIVQYIDNFEMNSKPIQIIENIKKETDKLKQFELIIDALVLGASSKELAEAIYENSKFQKINETVNFFRLSENYETLREKSRIFFETNGTEPKVFLANMGPLKQHKGRADFSSDFFNVAGFDVIYNNGFQSIEDAANSAIASEAKIITICSTDDTYPEIVPELTKAIKSKAPNKKVILAGYPVEFVEEFKKAGVDEFIHIKSNVYEILSNLQNQIGI